MELTCRGVRPGRRELGLLVKGGTWCAVGLAGVRGRVVCVPGGSKLSIMQVGLIERGVIFGRGRLGTGASRADRVAFVRSG